MRLTVVVTLFKPTLYIKKIGRIIDKKADPLYAMKMMYLKDRKTHISWL